MKKRHVLKKFSGVKKDGAAWYGIVLGAAFHNGTLYTEKLLFVPENAYAAIEQDTDIVVA